MNRDQVVSLRVTDSELEQLRELGGPTKALRRLLLERSAAAQALARQCGVTSSPAGLSYAIWRDGTVGHQWPAVMTG